jgi:hypothetical protein
MADFQAKICEKFNIKSLTDNQSKSKYLVFFVAGALGDSIRFGIFVVYQFHSGTIFASQGLRSALPEN